MQLAQPKRIYSGTETSRFKRFGRISQNITARSVKLVLPRAAKYHETNSKRKKEQKSWKIIEQIRQAQSGLSCLWQHRMKNSTTTTSVLKNYRLLEDLKSNRHTSKFQMIGRVRSWIIDINARSIQSRNGKASKESRKVNRKSGSDACLIDKLPCSTKM